jgi:hypothetical protein
LEGGDLEGFCMWEEEIFGFWINVTQNSSLACVLWFGEHFVENWFLEMRISTRLKP